MGFLSPEKFETIIYNIDEIFKDSARKPGWKNNVDVKNKIDQDIDDMFCEIENELNIKIDSNKITKILEKIRLIGINNYEE